MSHPRLALSLFTLLAVGAFRASADNMYKCVDGAGKIAYTSIPCQGKATEAKTFTVDTPMDDKALAAAERDRLRQLAGVKAEMSQREMDRRRAEQSNYSAYKGGGGLMRPGDMPTARKSDSDVAEEGRKRMEEWEAPPCPVAAESKLVPLDFTLECTT